jgi:predicted RND superfamily exporter protein
MIKPDRASRFLARVLRYRVAIVVAYAILVPAATWLATRIPSETSIEHLLAPDDPDIAATRAFQAIFPDPQLVLLAFESDDPWAPAALARVDRARAAIARVPGVAAFSLVDQLRRARPDADPGALRRLATGTAFFRRQGLVGDRFLTLVVHLDARDPSSRDRALAAIDAALLASGAGIVHEVGTPYINAWLEQQSAAATTRAFATFAVLLVAITLFLYRSVRALLAIVLALGAALALALAAGELLGFAFTIVSALVPLTVMVTTLATLTYLHSRFVDQPAGVPLEVHHVVALRSKLLPVTASSVAAASGFAALAVSRIEPIRQMGVWTAVGLAIAWLVAYTLFPALQRVLHTPTTQRVAVRTAFYDRVSHALPALTYRHRRVFVAVALATCVAGTLAVTGVPGVLAGIPVQVEALANIDPSSRLVRDARWYEAQALGLHVAHVWIHLPRAAATDPDVLQAIDRFQSQLDATIDVTGVAGPTTPLRLRSYLAGRGEALPADRTRFAAAVADVEQLLLSEPELRAFIDVGGLADLHLTVLFGHGDGAGYAALARRLQASWDATRSDSPALDGATMHVVGEALLEAKLGASLVPTLAESFVLTVALILIVFVVVFRSGLERLIAMIPSVFALLVTMLGLRLLGGSLNVATIIIATTVLGTTENDQMHFFHHMHERAGAPLEVRLRHTLRIAGRAVVFATLINAIGFLGLTASRFPPLWQFGLMTASAFVLALVADFLVLPAALWIASGERPAAAAAPSTASADTSSCTPLAAPDRSSRRGGTGSTGRGGRSRTCRTAGPRSRRDG